MFKINSLYVLFNLLILIASAQQDLYAMKKRLYNCGAARLTHRIGNWTRVNEPSKIYSPFSQSRSIVNSYYLKGLHKPFEKKEYLSPIIGAAFAQSNAIENLLQYQWDTKEDSNNEKPATLKLIHELFHFVDNKVRLANNKVKPAYSLDAELIAQIITRIENNTLNDVENLRSLITLWQAKHDRFDSEILEEEEIIKFCDIIYKSTEECSQGIFIPKFTQQILVTFLNYKAKNRKQLIDYINTLSLNGILDNDLDDTTKVAYNPDEQIAQNVEEGNRSLVDVVRANAISVQDKYKHEEFVKIFENMLNHENSKIIKSIFNHFEPIICTLMFKDKIFDDIYPPKYGLKDNSSFVHFPTAAAFHDAFNFIFYNPETSKFDLKMYPKLEPNLAVEYFYQMQSDIESVNNPDVIRDFIDMVSDHQFLEYRGEQRSFKNQYDLVPNFENFVKLMNYLFGINAQKVEDLNYYFSNAHRQVTFEEVTNLGGGNEISVIVITICHDQSPKMIVIWDFYYITANHIAENYEFFKKYGNNNEWEIREVLNKMEYKKLWLSYFDERDLLDALIENRNSAQALLVLPNLMKTALYAPPNNDKLTLAILNHLFISSKYKNLRIIKAALNQYNKYKDSYVSNFIINLLEKTDDENCLLHTIQEIVNSDKAMQDPMIINYIMRKHPDWFHLLLNHLRYSYEKRTERRDLKNILKVMIKRNIISKDNQFSQMLKEVHKYTHP